MSFIDKCLKVVINTLAIKRLQITTVKEKTLIVITIPSQKKLVNVSQFKYHVPFDLLPGVVYEYRSGKCSSSSYGRMDRHSKARSGKHMRYNHP